MPVNQLLAFFQEAESTLPTNNVLKRLLPEIIQRVRFLNEVGLGYLDLNRSTNTLSGGESQRIHLATSLGSSLVGSTYVLDEPSIGLHPRDTANLVRVLKQLKSLGNTVVIVEHEEEIMGAADHIIDIGPLAGEHGGTVVFSGDLAKLKQSDGLTAAYLTGKTKITVPTSRRNGSQQILMSNASLHNLKQVDLSIPLRQLVCITGVSGSGKSTLLKSLFYPGMKQVLFDSKNNIYRGCVFEGSIKAIQEIELIDQNPIGKSSRSNPITYLKIFDEIRDLYARQPLAKMRNYKPGFFSFNVEGGRCDACDGEGVVTIGMQFMADIQLTCEECKGTRFKEETLEINYREKSIADLLHMTLDELFSFFNESKEKKEKQIAAMIQPLLDVGLGYLRAGQASSTLSGGEAQRIKLASFLAKGSNQAPTLFLFDEPSTGLHFYDIEKLLSSFQALILNGHSIVVIEHNLDIIKTADHIIDIGPEGGDGGGKIVFAGTPEELMLCSSNHTADALRKKIRS
jgi:excinuclease ABC subunit A